MINCWVRTLIFSGPAADIHAQSALNCVQPDHEVTITPRHERDGSLVIEVDFGPQGVNPVLVQRLFRITP